MLLWGSFGFLGVLVPQPLSRMVAGRLAGVRVAAVAVVAAAALAALPLQTAMIGDGWSDAIDGGTLRDVLVATDLGEAWLLQVGASVLLVLAQLAPQGRRPPATALAAGLVLVSLAASGHAVMQQGWLGFAHQLTDVVHVLAAGAWFGALWPLTIVLAEAGKAPMRLEAITALRRFSQAGYIAVALALLSGIVNAALIMGWPAVWLTPYRALLAAKITAVLGMIAIAAVNRYRFVPRIGTTGPAALGAIRRGTAAEVALGLAAILLVSVFGLLDPN